ncbi:uncharacterized protein J8A68_001424, partial [[Candida] subhashii]
MARIFAPGNGQQQSQDQQQQQQSQSAPTVSLQAFTSQMTGNTMENTLQNAKIGQDMEALSKPLLQVPIPPPVRQRSVSSPMPQTPQISITVPNYRNGLHSPQVPPPVPPRSPLGRGP